MAKTIQFTFDGEDYTLEFSRRTVRDMEASGFKLADIKNKPMTAYPILFRGAFKCHHRRMDDAVADRIYAQITSKEAFIEKLVEMYVDTMNTLFEEPEESEKNVQWKASF